MVRDSCSFDEEARKALGVCSFDEEATQRKRIAFLSPFYFLVSTKLSKER